MNKKKVLAILGTRPEAIKIAPIIDQAKKSPSLECIVAVTGQHRSMLDQVNRLFSIKPDYDLDVFAENQPLNTLIARIIAGLDEVFDDCQPDAVVVQGDTTSAVAGAIAAFYRGIPVVHAEAGLRSYDIRSPFPEEANRKLASQLAQLHLAPTRLNKKNLVDEGIDETSIVVSGNTVIDALFKTLESDIGFSSSALSEFVGAGHRIVTVTTHRRENRGEKMSDIASAIADLARAEPQIRFVLPLHLNPVVRNRILPVVDGLENVLVTEPLNYAEFTKLLSISYLVLTDSGGVQEEAPSLGKPVLVMRLNTERPEGVAAGTVRLIGTEKHRIIESVSDLLHNPTSYAVMANAVNPYGDGRAAERTIAAIEELLGVGKRTDELDVVLPDPEDLIRAASI